MKIRLLESARKDLVHGYYFYERQSTGIGTYFLESVYADIDTLTDNAGIHPICFNEYHRLLVSRFPFAVYYKYFEDTVLVYAVLDCRREPAWVRSKLT